MKKLLKIISIILLILLFISFVYLGKGYKMYKNALNDLPINKMKEEIKSKKNYTNINEMPKIYLNAVISIEDHRFKKHKGIDIISLGRALVHDIKNMNFAEGGSTITQQLAKNVYFSQEKKIERKIAEIFMAFKLEKELSKDEILELYLNTSYFGDGYYTVKEASLGYFYKNPIDLTDYEATLLAGIPNAPSIYAPTQNPDLAKQRQRQVLDKMIEYGYLTKKEAKTILNEN